MSHLSKDLDIKEKIHVVLKKFCVFQLNVILLLYLVLFIPCIIFVVHIQKKLICQRKF